MHHIRNSKYQSVGIHQEQQFQRTESGAYQEIRNPNPVQPEIVQGAPHRPLRLET